MAQTQTTLREHLEAIRDYDYGWADDQSDLEIRNHAEAMLEILDNAERERNESRDPSNRYELDRVLIEDPKEAS